MLTRFCTPELFCPISFIPQLSKRRGKMCCLKDVLGKHSLSKASHRAKMSGVRVTYAFVCLDGTVYVYKCTKAKEEFGWALVWHGWRERITFHHHCCVVVSYTSSSPGSHHRQISKRNVGVIPLKLYVVRSREQGEYKKKKSGGEKVCGEKKKVRL